MTNDTAKADVELYSIDKLMHETRQLAAKYRQTTGNTLPVTGEIARFDAAKALKLKLIDDPASSFDALGTGERDNQRIIIKGRAIFESTRSSPRIGQLNPEQNWDLVVLVLFDDHYEPDEIYQASKEDIAAAMKEKEGSARKKRGAMSIAQFKIIGQRVWSRENGLEQEIWDNQDG
ncbi:hypothetical protein [Methylophaga sp. OBS4]|uniref:hypothetical protein n=1 Tax=Methylophaga sp. OBS4 TaxID=2991935 RepID=UPI0022516F81|nr:hypothetical protein [Methylophaga sp. OBS4]MCX4186861.1 hypothetical protein [Methylophaga sp. OBS4]